MEISRPVEWKSSFDYFRWVRAVVTVGGVGVSCAKHGFIRVVSACSSCWAIPKSCLKRKRPEIQTQIWQISRDIDACDFPGALGCRARASLSFCRVVCCGRLVCGASFLKDVRISQDLGLHV